MGPCLRYNISVVSWDIVVRFLSVDWQLRAPQRLLSHISISGLTGSARWRPFLANEVALVLPYTSIFLFPVQQRAVTTTPITPSVEEFHHPEFDSVSRGSASRFFKHLYIDLHRTDIDQILTQCSPKSPLAMLPKLGHFHFRFRLGDRKYVLLWPQISQRIFNLGVD